MTELPEGWERNPDWCGDHFCPVCGPVRLARRDAEEDE